MECHLDNVLAPLVMILITVDMVTAGPILTVLKECNTEQEVRRTNISVIVVGAGPSGLAAASRLAAAGVQVTVLEAQNRTGGRIHGFHFEEGDGQELELGAQWIHGQAGNVAFEIASEMDIIDDPEYLRTCYDEFWFSDDGKIWPQNFFRMLWSTVEQLNLKHQYNASSVGEYFKKELVSKFHSVARSSKTREMLRMFMDYLHRDTQVEGACNNWNDLSFYGHNILYGQCSGNPEITFKTNSGWSTLLTHFINAIPESAIKLGREVTHIKQLKDEVVVVGIDDVFKADFVLFTGSLGVLKARVRQLFVPPLQEQKLKAIDLMGFGTVNKIYLKFPTTWWPQLKFEGFSLLFEEPSNYSDEEMDSDWTRGILSFDTVVHRPNVLCAWIAGTAARRMEKDSDQQILDKTMYTLRKFLGKKYPAIPDPTHVKVTRWSSNQHIQGSYSFMSMKAHWMGLSFDDLARPFGRVHFAGEATHSTYFSTVHGAIESGWREADILINQAK